MRLSFLFFALAIVTPAFAQAATAPAPAQGAVGAATSMTPAPDVRAKQWLGLVDDQNYNDAYKQMSAASQGKTAMGSWATKVAQARAPLGAMANRDIKSIKLSKSLATVQFDSSFAHKAAAVETVVMTSDKGAWSVTSYSLD